MKITLKKEVGYRFKCFREAIGKTQTQLADELGVYQSTITNIEVGKTFPGIKYLYYFHRKYRLNVNWLLNDLGETFVSLEEQLAGAVSMLGCHVERSDPRFQQYVELINLMQIPVIEQVVLAKLVEMKVLAKDVVEEFRQKQKTG
jgi:DNA-binding XRE family transcriptional regulator